jgi:hypothetical protein
MKRMKEDEASAAVEEQPSGPEGGCKSAKNLPHQLNHIDVAIQLDVKAQGGESC